MTAAAKWIPRLEKLRDRLAGNNASQQEKARQTLMVIRDPDAVEAIDTVFCRPNNDLSLLGIELLKNIPTPRATAVLAWHAAYSPWLAPWTPVGQAAATALRSREKYDYVPLLLDVAETPVQAPTHVTDKPTRPNRQTALAQPAIDSSPGTRHRLSLGLQRQHLLLADCRTAQGPSVLVAGPSDAFQPGFARSSRQNHDQQRDDRCRFWHGTNARVLRRSQRPASRSADAKPGHSLHADTGADRDVRVSEIADRPRAKSARAAARQQCDR